MSALQPRRSLFVIALVGLILAGCGGSKKEEPTTARELSTRDKVRMAQSLMGAGRMGEALELLESAIEGEPDNAQLFLFYGKMSFQAGRNEEAEQAFLAALDLDPYLTDARNFLGVVYTVMGRIPEAEDEFRIALKDPAYPTPELVYLNLGLAYGSQGRDEEAISVLRSAVELSPKFYKAHFELASLLDRVGRIDEAASEYEVASPDYRNVGEFYYRLGFVYFRLGDKAKARVNLEQAMTVSPGSNSASQANDLLKMMN